MVTLKQAMNMKPSEQKKVMNKQAFMMGISAQDLDTLGGRVLLGGGLGTILGAMDAGSYKHFPAQSKNERFRRMMFEGLEKGLYGAGLGALSTALPFSIAQGGRGRK